MVMTGMAARPTHLHGFDKRSFTQVDRYHFRVWMMAPEGVSDPSARVTGTRRAWFSANCYVPKGFYRRTIVDSKRRTNPVVSMAFA